MTNIGLAIYTDRSTTGTRTRGAQHPEILVYKILMHICEFLSQLVWSLILCSILFVSLAFIITSRIYKKMHPQMNLDSKEVVLIPFRFGLVYEKMKTRSK